MIEKEGWQANHASPEEILRTWNPASRNSVESDQAIVASVSEQKWRGLAIKDFGGEKGLGKKTFIHFSSEKGICENMGKVSVYTGPTNIITL